MYGKQNIFSRPFLFELGFITNVRLNFNENIVLHHANYVSSERVPVNQNVVISKVNELSSHIVQIESVPRESNNCEGKSLNKMYSVSQKKHPRHF